MPGQTRVVFKGLEWPLKALLSRYNQTANRFWSRRRKGWSVEEALLIPAHQTYRYKDDPAE